MSNLLVRHTRHTSRRASMIVCFALMLVMLSPSLALAHPLGNFTVSRYSRLELNREQINLIYIIDMAEIPTQQERSQIDIDGDGTFSTAEQEAYLGQWLPELQRNLQLTLNGEAVNWAVAEHALSFPEGQAGLPTMRLRMHFVAGGPDGDGVWQADYQDNNFSGRLGWQEVIVQAQDGITLLDSTASSADISHELTSYPTDLLQSPMAVRQAVFQFQPTSIGTLTASPQQSAQVKPTVNVFGVAIGRPTDRFAELIELPVLGPWAILLALLAAFGWGAAHAFSPGHGKTVVAAYLVGSRGTVGHALFLGLTTTITHTAGVFVLGLITLFAAQYILPETLYPWLSVLSGVLVAVIGLTLIRERWRSPVQVPQLHDHDHQHAHDHAHDHQHAHEHGNEHTHTHHEHSHGIFGHHHHGPEDHSHMPPGADGSPVTWRGLLALGISGGLLPCPSALVLMLGAISLQRIGFGLALIVLFSLGLASVLTLIGVTLVYAGKYFTRIPESGRLLRLLPVASAVFITAVGVGITVQALVNTGALRLL
ncbi:MAG: sulfite exporter TauE/SafE family protein [Caldilineaceae bacterium]